MKKKLAIIGSGISATSCAYYLRDEYEISIFEKNDYLGGHTHTHKIIEKDSEFTIDTGFIVFNLKTYPNLIKFFDDLGVKKQESNMSFSVWNLISNLQYSGSGLSYLFAQKKNIFSLQFWKFLLEINTFFKVATKDLKTIINSKQTISEYCKINGLSDFFLENYLVPMSSAVWSAEHGTSRDLPISLILPFFYNHGLLGINQQLQWYTVKNGSNDYVKKIFEKGSYDVHLNEEVKSIEETKDSVIIKTIKGDYTFDFVIAASHSDESVNIVKSLSTEKKDILNKFKYKANRAVLHTDDSIMPPIKKVWSSWNYIINKNKIGNIDSSTVYWINPLQKLPTKTNYFLSINPFQNIDSGKIIKELHYQHPNFTVENFATQDKLCKLNENTRIFFSGAYFGYGFHEDGIKSGLEVVKKLKTLA